MDSQYLGFMLDRQSYGLHLSAVERVIPVAATATLPHAPPVISGILNLHGEVIPVIDIRARFQLPPAEIRPGDRLIIARTPRRKVAIRADSVTGIMEIPPGEIVALEKLVPSAMYIEGFIKLRDGMVLLHDLETLLSLEEGLALDGAILGPEAVHD